MSTYAERLAEALHASGMSKAGFARKLGVSYQAITKALVGNTKSFSAPNNHQAAALLGVSAEWLATGQGPAKPTGQQFHPLSEQEAAILRILRALPESGRAEADRAIRGVAEQHAKRLGKLLDGGGEA